MTRSLALVAPSETRRSRSRLAQFEAVHATLTTETQFTPRRHGWDEALSTLLVLHLDRVLSKEDWSK